MYLYALTTGRNLAASMESRISQYEELTVLCISDVISCGMISKQPETIAIYLGFANAVGHHASTSENK